MKQVRTWILIADAGRARVLSGDGSGKSLEPVAGLNLHHELPPTRELVDDRQARSYESVGSARHAISGGIDPHRKEKRRFADEIANALDERLENNAFDRLVIVAPPQALGDLRAALSASVKNRVVHEVTKDLTKTPDHEVVGHLGLSFQP